MNKLYILLNQFKQQLDQFKWHITVLAGLLLAGIGYTAISCNETPPPVINVDSIVDVVPTLVTPVALPDIDSIEKARRDSAAKADIERLKKDMAIDPFLNKAIEEVFDTYKDSVEKYVKGEISLTEFCSRTQLKEVVNGKTVWRPSPILEKICKQDSVWHEKFREVDKLMQMDN